MDAGPAQAVTSQAATTGIPGRPTGAGVPAPTRLRATDADREAVVRVLQDGVARGALTLDEGGDRMSAAWATRYRDELGGLTADLPAPLPAPRAAPGWAAVAGLAGAQLAATFSGVTPQDRLRRLLVVAAALVGALVVLLGVVAVVHGLGGTDGPPFGTAFPHHGFGGPGGR